MEWQFAVGQKMGRFKGEHFDVCSLYIIVQEGPEFHAQAQFSDLILDRYDEVDRAKAASLLSESLAISSELGMRPLMERVLSRREILKA